MLKYGLFACITMLAAAPAALAGGLPPGESRAVLAQPVGPYFDEAIVDGRVWRCNGVNCTAHVNPSDEHRKPAIECRDAAQKIGRFVSYETGDTVFTEADLAACGKGLK